MKHSLSKEQIEWLISLQDYFEAPPLPDERQGEAGKLLSGSVGSFGEVDSATSQCKLILRRDSHCFRGGWQSEVDGGYA